MEIAKSTFKNAIIFISGEGFWGFNASLVSSATVLAVLLRELGAGDRMIGSIGAIEAGLLVIPQLLGMYLFSSKKNRKRKLIIWHLTGMIPFLFASGLLIVFERHFSPFILRGALLLSYACFMAAIGMIAGVWLDWLAHLFEEKIRGTVMGLSFFASALMGTFGGFAAGFIIKSFEGHFPYAILYFTAGFFASVSIITFFLVDDPADSPDAAHACITISDIVSSFRKSIQDSNFRSFLICRLLASFGFCIVPFIAIYFKSPEGGSLSSSLIVSCGAAMSFGSAISNLALGRFGDRYGHRIGVILGTVMQALTLCLLIFGSGKFLCIIVYFMTGICVSCSFISHTNMLLETCPHDCRIAHLTVGNLILSLPMIVAPLLAGTAADAFGLKTVFTVCAILSGMAFLWGILLVKDPRYIKVMDVQHG